MDNDDQLVGRVLSRREVLALLGAAGAALLVACLPESEPAQPVGTATTTQGATSMPTKSTAQGTPTQVAATTPTQGASAANTATVPSCVVRPELTEGPYFVDERLERSDIRSDPSDGSVKEGAPLEIVFRVSEIGAGCVPLAGAAVDVWHCDALGVYSDATDRGFTTVGQKFLRGYQVTDANGEARFTTVYPGWYQGRAVHIHFKIRTDLDSNQGYEFTSQFFFDEAVTDEVHAQQPYASKGYRTLKNEGDGIFRQGGSELMLPVVKAGNGYTATFDIGLQI
jgi:protocatechuate 3,4-dioxygenase beta subunit